MIRNVKKFVFILDKYLKRLNKYNYERCCSVAMAAASRNLDVDGEKYIAVRLNSARQISLSDITAATIGILEDESQLSQHKELRNIEWPSVLQPWKPCSGKQSNEVSMSC